MISLDNVGKIYNTRNGQHKVLEHVNLSLKRGEKLGVLGRNGAGKSTLIRLIGGAEQPTTGTVSRGMTVSWPLAFSGAFQGSLTGLDNFRFVCRVYGVDWRPRAEYVQDFAELGSYFREPLRTYSSGMRARLAFAISMAVEFDCFLIDEIIAVGDSRFHEKCHRELFEKRSDRAFLIVSHDPGYIRTHCASGAVLEDGRLHVFDSVDEAYARYELRAD